MVDDVDWGKVSNRPPERSLEILPAEPCSSKSGRFGQRKLRILSAKYFFRTHRVLSHVVNSHGMGPPALLPHRREVWCGFFRS
jgi:hypothetical protein